MKELRRFGLATLAACLLAASTAASPQRGPDSGSAPSPRAPQAESRTLANGLVAIALDQPGTATVDAVMACLAGHAFDPPGGSGTAHLVEHFLARPVVGIIGPPKELIAELTREYEKTGGQDSERTRQLEQQMASWKGKGRWNIATTPDLVHYGVSDYPAAGIERFFAAADTTLRMLPDANLELHRKGIVNELRRLERQPMDAMKSANAVAAFGAGHPYGVPAGGRVEDLQEVTLEQLRAFAATYYSPDRCAVAVVGDVRAAAALDLVERFLGGVPKKPAAPGMRRPARATGERQVSVPSAGGPKVLVNFLKPPIPSPEDSVATVVASLLARDGRWSLREDVVQQRKLATEAWCSNGGSWQLADNLFTIGAEPAPGAGLEHLEAALLARVERLREDPVAEEDVQAAIRAVLAQPVVDGSGFALALNFARNQLTAGDWRALWKSREASSHVTPAHVTAFARKYLVPANRTVVRLLPESK